MVSNSTLYDDNWYLRVYYGCITKLRKEMRECKDAQLLAVITNSISSLGKNMYQIKCNAEREGISKELAELKAKMGITNQPVIQFSDEITT